MKQDSEQTRIEKLFPVAPADHLGHARYATSLIERISRLPDGSAVALRANWGRGKTDVLGRVIRNIKSLDPGDQPPFAYVFGMSPWRHTESDLVGPLLADIGDVLKPMVQDTEWPFIGNLLLTVARWSTALGIAHAAVHDPTLLALAPHADQLVKYVGAKVGKEASQSLELEPSPGEQFSKVIDRLLKDKPANARVLICIDDLDRCLPAKQVAFIEAIHFLKTHDLRAIFLCAIDSRLLRSACQSHFGSSAFDSDAYLEKIFDYTQDMNPLEASGSSAMIRSELSIQIKVGDTTETALDILSKRWITGSPNGLEHFFDRACGFTSMSSARNIVRVCNRLRMLSYSPPPGNPLTVGEHWKHLAIWLWLAATQQWPPTRALFSGLSELLRKEQLRFNTIDRGNTSAAGWENRWRQENDAYLKICLNQLHEFHEVCDRLQYLAEAANPAESGRFDNAISAMMHLDNLMREQSL